MIITVYSFLMAIMWFTTFVLVAELLRRKTGFLLQYNIGSMLFLIVICVVRICIPIETSMTIVVPSERIFVSIQRLLLQTVDIAGIELSWLTLLLGIWAVGSGVRLVRFGLYLKKDNQTVRTIVLFKQKDADEAHIAGILDGIAMQTPTCRRYQLIISPQVPTPMVTGLLTPKILLPPMVSQLADEDLYHVLTHEWYHLVNRDVWVKCLVELLCCVMWWNPVVYLLKKSVEQALEIKCDLSVTKDMNLEEKTEYLQTILLFVTRFSNQKTNVLVGNMRYLGITEDIAIRQRFHMVLNHQQSNRAKPITFVVTMSLLMLLSYSFVIQPHILPPLGEIDGLNIVTSENAYILARNDGTFELFVEGKFFRILPKAELYIEPHNLLLVVYQ